MCHLGHAGGTLFVELAAPIMLGFWWACLPALAIATLFVMRTLLDDRTLQAELKDYVEFTRQSPYRLIPAIWSQGHS